MRCIPLGLSFLFSCSATFAGNPVEEFNKITARIQKEVRTQFFEATAFPDSKVSRELPATIHAIISTLESLPDPPGVPKIIAADKHRQLAYLYLVEARVYGALAASPSSPNGDRFVPQRTKLARQALRELAAAERWLLATEDTTDTEYSLELRKAIEQSRIKPHSRALLTTAHSILWVLEKNPADKTAARNAWSQINDAGFQSEFKSPAPEVSETLDIDPITGKPSGMTAISWTGIALLLIGLLVAIFVRDTSAFQQWAVRVIIAIGAAMTATVIPGLLNIDIPKYVAAGGALAVIVLIYWFNPPKIEDSRSNLPPNQNP